jgi:hypothetical protein
MIASTPVGTVFVSVVVITSKTAGHRNVKLSTLNVGIFCNGANE